MAKRTALIYADSGETKTTQLYQMAKWLLSKNPGKKIRLISADGGGYAPFIDSGMIERGEVEVFDYVNRPRMLADIHRLKMGYWPKKAKSKETGLPVEFFQTDPRCLTTEAEWGKIIGYMIEGVSSISQAWLSHMRRQEDGVGFKHSFKYEEDGFSFGGLQQGHYGLAQQELYEVIVNGFSALPVEWVIWTSHVDKGEDRDGTTVYAPAAAGNAINAKIPSWFQHSLHLSTEKVREKVDNSGVEEEREVSRKVAWFTQHTHEQTGIPYLVKPRIMPEIILKMLEKFPNGYVPLGYKRGIDVYFEIVERMTEEFRKEKGN